MHFNDQPIHYELNGTQHVIPQTLSGGHSGVALINDHTGVTAYREFGRYDGTAGKVQSRGVANLQMDKSGVPTRASLQALLKDVLSIGARAGSHNISITFTYGSKYDDMMKEVSKWTNKDWNFLTGDTCHGFCRDVVRSGVEGDSRTFDLTDQDVADTAAKIRQFYQNQVGGQSGKNGHGGADGWSMWGGGMVTGSRLCGRLGC